MGRNNKSRSISKQPSPNRNHATLPDTIELPKDIADVLDSLPKEKREKLIAATLTIQHSRYSGPIPHPSFMHEYESILPGSADRIIAMSEKEQQHRHGIEALEHKAMIQLNKQGLWLGFFLELALIASAVICAFIGHTFISGSFALVSIALGIIFVLRREPKDDNIGEEQKKSKRES